MVGVPYGRLLTLKPIIYHIWQWKRCMTYHSSRNYPANIYLFKVHNRNTRERCGICLKLTIKTPERRQWRRSGVRRRRSGVFIVKGALMQIWKSLHILKFIQKYYPENVGFLIVTILELFTRKVGIFLKIQFR